MRFLDGRRQAADAVGGKLACAFFSAASLQTRCKLQNTAYRGLHARGEWILLACHAWFASLVEVVYAQLVDARTSYRAYEARANSTVAAQLVPVHHTLQARATCVVISSDGGVPVTQCASAPFVQYLCRASAIAVRLITIRWSNPGYKVSY